MASLTGKSAIITGSTSGIGLGIAHALAAEGCNILLNGFGDKETVTSIQKELRERYHVSVSYSPANMAKPSDIEAMVRMAAKEFGGAEILVNNAGIQHVARIEDFPAEKWDEVLAINLSSAFHTIRHALPYMKKAGFGRIINIASAHGLVASVNKSGYVAAKHGLIGLSKVVALENAGMGITCNAICPGWVLTPLVQKQIDTIAAKEKISIKEAELRLLSEKQPSKQFVTVQQIGAFVTFLCSDAASNITGSALSMDGGWVAQ